METVKGAGDVVAVPTVFAFTFNWVPVVAGIVATIYTALRVFELIEKRWEEGKWPFGTRNEANKNKSDGNRPNKKP